MERAGVQGAQGPEREATESDWRLRCAERSEGKVGQQDFRRQRAGRRSPTRPHPVHRCFEGSRGAVVRRDMESQHNSINKQLTAVIAATRIVIKTGILVFIVPISIEL